jgi:hypothetical protein
MVDLTLSNLVFLESNTVWFLLFFIIFVQGFL